MAMSATGQPCRGLCAAACYAATRRHVSSVGHARSGLLSCVVRCRVAVCYTAQCHARCPPSAVHRLPSAVRPPSENIVLEVGCGDRLGVPRWPHPADRRASRRALNSRISDGCVANGRMSRAENLHPAASTGSSVSGSMEASKEASLCPQPAAACPARLSVPRLHMPVLLPPQRAVAVPFWASAGKRKPSEASHRLSDTHG